MKYLFLLTFSAMASLPAFATEYKPFKQIEKSLRESLEFQRQVTIPLHVSTGMHCSAVFVGPNGEALTNLHCLEDCLVANNVVTKKEIAGTDFSLLQPQVGSSCKVKFGMPLQDAQAQVLQIFGPGWISPREKLPELMEKRKDILLPLMNEGYESAGDLALVRLPVQNNACVAIGDTTFNGMEKLTSLSYPLVFRRDPTQGPFAPSTMTFGTTLMYSEGEATMNPALFADAAKELPNLPSMLPPMFTNGVIMSDTDTEGGASGSPLFSGDGKLVALTRSTWKGEVASYVHWTSQSVNLVMKKDLIEALIPGVKNCR